MRRRWIALAVALLALVVVTLGAAYRLLHDEGGLQWALVQLSRIPGVRIEASGARGTLAGPMSIERLVVDHAAVRIEAHGLRLALRAGTLPSGAVHLTEASAERVDVVLKSREPQPPSQPHFLPRFLTVSAPGLRLGEVSLTLANGRRYDVADLRGALSMTRWRIDVADLVVEDPRGRIDGALTLRATLPLGLRAAANGAWQLPDERDYRFAAAARGNLDRLDTTLTLAAPADLSFVGTALTLTGTPRIVGTLRAREFDGAPWLSPGRLPSVSGSIAVDAGLAAIGLDGTLVAPAFGEGPLRLQGSARWNDPALEIVAFKAWLPRSTLALGVTGTVAFDGDAPRLALEGEWTTLRWPLEGDPVVESAFGSGNVRGELPYAFELQGQFRAPTVNGTPSATVAAGGTIGREMLVLERLEGEALRGRVEGSGQLAWADPQAWTARLDARGLDLDSVRPDLGARLSVRLTADGRGFAPNSPWTVRLAELSGVIRGRALTGRGEIGHDEGTYDLRGVRIANGPSYVDVDGRWGRDVDLRWNADLRSLDVLHPDLAGTFVSSGRARGSSERPQVEGRIHGEGLVLAGVGMATLDGEFDVDAADARPSQAVLRATEVALGPITFDAMRFDAAGLASEHRLSVEFSSAGEDDRRLPAFRGRIVASGRYAGEHREWRGLLQEAEVTFPDGGATLLQPAAIELTGHGQRFEPICLTTGDARLCAEGERRVEPAEWRVIYSAQDWPLRRLLRTLLGWKEFDGRLQGAGWIVQREGEDWTGGTSLLLDQPTLDVPRNQFRTERIELGGGRLDVFAEPGTVRALLDMNLTEETRVHGEVVAERLPGVATTDYPLAGSIHGSSTALTAIPVFVPEIDRSDGSLEATVTVGGTIGAPRFDGEFHVRDGRFDIYRSNLLLSDVTLDGRFVGDELVFEGNGRTARGTLKLDGQFTWPGDVMTGEMHLVGSDLMLADTPSYRVIASPDLTFTAGVHGYAVRGDVLIPTARITPRDLSTTVGTSPDERIVGTEEEDAGPSTLERVRTRVRVELGDNVRVDTHGLRARLEGAVTVLSRPGDIVRGNGAIRVVDGEYKAFGQYVRITRGVLSYNRTPLDDPTLDLVAEREIRGEDLVVSVNVRGTLAEPFVTLSSEPAMSDQEALSYLLTGRSINTLQSGDAAAVNRAATSLALGGGGMLLGGIGERIGIDEVTVEQTGDDDTSVVLGKYLSPNLFVSYGISIAEAINTIKLRYTLNKRWSLKAEAGLEQSADIEYRIER